MEPTLRPLLEEMKRESGGKGRLFSDPPAATGEYGLAKLIREHIEAAGIEREELRRRTKTSRWIVFHDLRATGAVWRFKRNGPKDTITDVTEDGGWGWDRSSGTGTRGTFWPGDFLIGRARLYDAAVPTRRVLSGVLQGFIGTYTSRYSHFDGYWLFGFLVSEFAHLEVDLLSEPFVALSTAEGRARFLAVLKFREQLGRAGLPVTNVARATLTIDRGEPSVQLAGERARAGFTMRFRCRVTADNGRIFEHAKDVFVAPHDPRCESQSAGTRP